MGLHNTKGQQPLASANDENRPCRSTATISTSIKCKSSSVRERINYCGWQEIYRCSHAEWLHDVSERFGFTPHLFTCNSDLHSICAPGFCSESLSRNLHHGYTRCPTRKSRPILSSSSTKSKKLREHFEYNHIPAMISSLQNYSVHGIVNGSSPSDRNNGDTIMLSIYSTSLDKTKFIMVDLKLNRYLCALENDYHGLMETSKVHSAWSMDRTQVILRVPTSDGNTALDFYKVFKKEARLYRRIAPIDSHTQFQFHPNYWSSRLVLYTSMTLPTTMIIHYNTLTITPGGSDKVQTHAALLPQLHAGASLISRNLPTWSNYQHEPVHFDDSFRLLALLFTLDSVYLILTFADLRCHCGPTLSISYFDIYHANTLQRLHRLHTQLIAHICPLHMCRNFLTPIVSVSSSRMAFCTSKNNGGRELQVSIIVLPNELNLKSICRRSIREYLHQWHGTVEEIARELPHRLGQYIQYRPEYQ